MRTAFLILLVLIVVAGVTAFALTGDGERVTPKGEGTVVLEAGEFETFPLPGYAAAYLTDQYKSYFVEVEPGIKVHVVEVGSGLPVFLQHGNPTNGLLYREVAEQLPIDRVRVIMPTLVGLGFSSKIPASEHTLDNHMRWINSVLVQLQLEELVYAGQDWGGPVGMGALALSPGLLKGAVVLNTGLNAPTEAMALSRAHAIVKTPLVGELIATQIFDRLPQMQGDPGSMPDGVLDLYRRPVRDSGNTKAPLAMMRMVTDGPDHVSAQQMRFIENYVGGLDIPVEIVWGMKDPILAKGLPMMRRNFPQAPVTETQGGHFLQEEVPDVIAAALLRVIDRVELSETEAEIQNNEDS